MIAQPNRRRASKTKLVHILMIFALAALALMPVGMVVAQGGPVSLAVDPGVRPGLCNGVPCAGGPLAGLSGTELTDFGLLQGNFAEVNAVQGGAGNSGLGPRFNSNSCASCHRQVAIGGGSPATNPFFFVVNLDNATNTMPFFETNNGPAINAHFVFQSDLKTLDGSTHQLFTITGRSDAGTCNIAQPDFVTAANENNLVFHQPQPVFGDGIIEIIKDSDILNNMTTVCNGQGIALGICGHPNISPDDGTVGRFGWKAQSRSLIIFSGEAYNVEEGVTTEFSPNELDETAGCVINPLPEDGTNFSTLLAAFRFPGDPERQSLFMRFLAPPTQGSCNAACQAGQALFNSSSPGCALCHTQSYTTPATTEPALSNITGNLYSDLLLHHMGPCLADNIVQNSAQGDDFRTAPLWGVGQRIFFLHDGRTTDIVQAIEDHFCLGNSQYPSSEANAVINAFNALGPQDQQDIVDFLRSL